MNFQLMEELFEVDNTKTHLGVTSAALGNLRSKSGIILPRIHQELLRTSNGIEAYSGYFRLFGIDTVESIDAIKWNQYDCWQFAWGSRCRDYWCFGETAWGDQYAYFSDTLREREDSEIYFLDAYSMSPQQVASSFADFLEKEFLRSAKQPYDVLIPQARQKLGPLEVSSHLVYVPSILLGGSEDIQHVQKMNARAAMISNGDIALQIEAGPADGAVKAVQPYEDELHRARLRILWA